MNLSRKSTAYKIVKANFPNENETNFSNLCPFARRLIASIIFFPITWIGFMAEAIIDAITGGNASLPFIVRIFLSIGAPFLLVFLPYMVGSHVVDSTFLAWLLGILMLTGGVIGVILISEGTNTVAPSIGNGLYNGAMKIGHSSIWTTISSYYKAVHDSVCPFITFKD